MSMSLRGKAPIVTGGASAIGLGREYRGARSHTDNARSYLVTSFRAYKEVVDIMAA